MIKIHCHSSTVNKLSYNCNILIYEMSTHVWYLESFQFFVYFLFHLHKGCPYLGALGGGVKECVTNCDIDGKMPIQL